MKTRSITFATLTCGEIFASAFIIRSEPVLPQASPQDSWIRLAQCTGCGNGNGNGNIGVLNGNFQRLRQHGRRQRQRQWQRQRRAADKRESRLQMEFRRALVVHFLKDWAAAEKVELLSLVPERAHSALREGIACRMIIFNAGVGSCASPDTISEIRILRALAPAASLVVMADEESRDDVIAVMQSGAEGYLSNQSAPDLVLRALSFVLEGGTYFPRSAVALAPFSGDAPLKAVPEASCAELHAPVGALPASAAEQSSTDSHLSELSERQKAILEGLCRGEPNKIIGRALNLPESTVKVHVREIMRKLSVSNRTQVAVVVSRMGGTSADKHGDDS
jgi:DNA-binding NarL/FixJ family response regulator